MSFTSDVKLEISLKERNEEEERAELSALLQMTSSLSISSKGTALSVKTENAPVSRAIYRLIRKRYDAQIETSVRRKMNLNKNLIYGLKIYGDIRGILSDLGIYSKRGLLERPLKHIVTKDACARAYLAGAFMAGGSVNSPQTSSYHLEIKTETEVLAEFISELMERFYISSRIIQRRNRYIVYIKAAEKIADFLRCIGAENNLLSFENERISRDFTNNVQRLNNVDVANEVKSMKAAKAQLEDIETLEQYDRLRKLDEKVRAAAELRKTFPEASLNELAEEYEKKTGITVSKSGMKHRFNKIHEEALKVSGRDV